MASLTTHKGGKKRGSRVVSFTRGDERKHIYLGKIPERVAQTILRHV